MIFLVKTLAFPYGNNTLLDMMQIVKPKKNPRQLMYKKEIVKGVSSLGPWFL